MSPNPQKPYLSGQAADQPTDAESLESKRVLMFLAQGFEDTEATTVLNVF